MLISKTALVKWNSKNKKYYCDLGYEFTKMGDFFEVKIEHLTKGSIAMVKYICDYCHKEKETSYHNYNKKQKNNDVNKDCCEDCLQIKAKESMFKKYGTYSCRDLDWVNEKIKNTNLEKYGCENPFGNKEIQEKIKQYYINNFNVTHNMQIPEMVQKAKATNLERYGVENYGGLWSIQHAGELSPKWKGDDVKHERTERHSLEYRHWRKAVFDRDLYTCQCCNARNGNGKYIRLEAHHIKNWADNIGCRYDLDNGITLCSDCHTKFHSEYGKKNNTQEQLDNFILLNSKDKKVC